MPKVLILEDDEAFADYFIRLLEKEPVEIVVVKAGAEAKECFGRERFDVIVLDGIAPSEEGRRPSLIGPVLACEFRGAGYRGPIIATSSDPQAQTLTKKGAEQVISHRAYACDKLDLIGLIRELLGLWPTNSV